MSGDPVVAGADGAVGCAPTRDLDAFLAELARSEARNRILFANSPLALIVYSPENDMVLAVNPVCAAVLGYPDGKWHGRSFGVAVYGGESDEVLQSPSHRLLGDPYAGEQRSRVRLLHGAGHIVEFEAMVCSYPHQQRDVYLLVLLDTRERRQSEEHLRRMLTKHRAQLQLSANYDSLTGLPNRTLFAERARQGLFQSQLSDSSMAVCYLDLDSFASLNAAHGQTVCDHLLINVAECLRRCLRGGDTLFRIGSDEFVLIILGIRNDEDVRRVLEGLQERLSEPFVSDTARVTVSASIGATLFPLDYADPETLLRHALQAMLQSKHNGPGGFLLFDAEGDRRVRARRASVGNVYAALERHEFVLYYQPKVDLMAKRVVGVEALIRWCHPQQGLLFPGAFLPAIEDDRVMIALGAWVIREALAQCARWRKAGLDLSVSVNITAQHLLDPRFVGDLRELLCAHPELSSGSLEIEVLESCEIGDSTKVEQVIAACHALGVGFALDDFGTGYSSLTYLRHLSADTLKIDQSFVGRMLDDPGDLAIVSGVIGLAAAFRRKLIAEGVETVNQAQLLLRLGCHVVQGYGIARPMAAELLPAWAATWPDEAWAAIGYDSSVSEGASPANCQNFAGAQGSGCAEFL